MCVSSAMLQAGGQLVQGFSDASTHKANARGAIIEGQSAVMAAESEAAKIRKAGERILGSNRAAQAASGVDLSYGSADEVNRETATNIEKDALLAGYQGRLQYSKKMYQAQLLKRQAKSAVLNASIGAASTILGSAEKAVMGGMGGGG